MRDDLWTKNLKGKDKYQDPHRVNSILLKMNLKEIGWKSCYCIHLAQDRDTRRALVNKYDLIYTGLFISPSGISELDCATTKTDTAESSISIGRESLQVFFCTRGIGVLPGSTTKG